MSHEFSIPSQQDLFSRIIRTGRTPQQFLDMIDVLQGGLENGVIRSEISCWENKEAVLDIIRRSYDSRTIDGLRDAESGIHMARCDAPTCGRLAQAYFERPDADTEEDLIRVGAEYVEHVAREVVTGIDLPHLIGKEVGYYDPSTGLMLPVVKAVDITHLCRPEENVSKQLRYINPRAGLAVNVQRTGPLVDFGVLLPIHTLEPSDGSFMMHARVNKVDPNMLFEIIHANAPQV